MRKTERETPIDEDLFNIQSVVIWVCSKEDEYLVKKLFYYVGININYGRSFNCGIKTF